MAEVFIDTSAMLALLVPSDSSHSAAKQIFDTVSFIAIREHRIESVFAFDGHFDDEGFKPPE